MRTVNENTLKPKLSKETIFVVDIRATNHNGAAVSSVNAATADAATAIASTSNGASNINIVEVNSTEVTREALGVATHHVDDGMHRGLDGSRSRNSIAEVNWRRVFTVSSLIVSLLLISGSIYLHLQHKPHLGRLHSSPASSGVASTPEAVDIHDGGASAPVAASRATLVGAETSGNSTMASSATLSATTTTTTTVGATTSTAPQQKWYALPALDSRTRHITEACMQCICDTATECSTTKCANNIDCGVFRISQSYWYDAGKPILEGDDEHNISNMDTTYIHCVNNVYCATRAVAAYINKYARDCNRDGVIECRDHIALHLLGPTGCTLAFGDLSPVYVRRMENCLAQYD